MVYTGTEAKEQLYKQIHEDYKLKTYSYLGASFNYGTFFKGKATFDPIKTNRNLITQSLQVMKIDSFSIL